MLSAGHQPTIESTLATNSLQVILPPGMSAEQARQLLAGFGEVMFSQVVPTAMGASLLLAFFDARCASQAQLALGFDWCRPAPQSGNRRVKLPGTVKLSPSEAEHISKVETDPEDVTNYIVEFFDVRHAQKAEARSAAAKKPLPQGLEPPPGLEVPNKAKAPELPKARPAYIPCKPDFGASGRPGRDAKEKVEVFIKGLPKALCTDAFLETMLEQAGLEEALLESKALTGKFAGQARVCFTSRKAAKICIKHFNGRLWGTSTEPVVATMGPVTGVAPATKLGLPFASTRLEMVPEDVFLGKVRTASEDTTSSTVASSSGTRLPPPPPPLEQENLKGQDPPTDASTADDASDMSDQERQLLAEAAMCGP
mmetsp:Transcript_91183/g.162372  ORF Transcript_91183/g.162372 Transcript_91183/m.162372 type:complete len:368 (-) Transcript_91183:240-1343(-)